MTNSISRSTIDNPSLQMHGFNFIKHLPYFVVLTFVLQRFQNCYTLASSLEVKTDRKEKEKSRPRFEINDQVATIRIQGREFTFNTADSSTRYVLNGRGMTGVLVKEVTHSGRNNPMDISYS